MKREDAACVIMIAGILVPFAALLIVSLFDR